MVLRLVILQRKACAGFSRFLWGVRRRWRRGAAAACSTAGHISPRCASRFHLKLLHNQLSARVTTGDAHIFTSWKRKWLFSRHSIHATKAPPWNYGSEVARQYLCASAASWAAPLWLHRLLKMISSESCWLIFDWAETLKNRIETETLRPCTLHSFASS